MKASSKCHRIESFGVTPPPPSSTGDTTAKETVDLATAAIAAAAVPPPSTSNNSDIRHMLETVITVQAAHGQLLVDMLDELRAL